MDVFGENVTENRSSVEGDPKKKEVMNDVRKAWLGCPVVIGSRSIAAGIDCGSLHGIGRGP